METMPPATVSAIEVTERTLGRRLPPDFREFLLRHNGAEVECLELVWEVGPVESIVSYAVDHRVDLIVIATHGRTGLSHVLMGSVAERIVREAPCPVLTIRDRHRGPAIPHGKPAG